MLTTSSAQFWPPDRSYTVAPLRLLPPSRMSPETRRHLPAIRDACALVDALRRLQDHRPDGGEPAIVEILRGQLLAVMTSMWESMPSDGDRDILDARIAVLRGDLSPTDPAVQHRLYHQAESELSVYCGRLKTWSMKSDHRYWSFFASAPAPEAEAIVRSLDGNLLAIDAELADQIGFAAHLSAPPRFVIHDLIACAGESARFPKHFAYFLPEDEGVEGARFSKTVVFRNVYAHRFEAASEALLERYFPEAAATLETRPSTLGQDALPIWMYGHDVGHMCTLGRVHRVLAPGLGKFGSASLDELKADLISVAVIATPSWQALSGIRFDEALRFYLGELLRYLTRDRHQFFDSASAFMQVAFLVENDCIRIENGDRIVGDPATVAKGLGHMLRELHHLARGGSKELRALLRHYLIDGPDVAAVAQLTESMMQGSRDIPRYTSYV